jgi:hypothetical protein
MNELIDILLNHITEYSYKYEFQRIAVNRLIIFNSRELLSGESYITYKQALDRLARSFTKRPSYKQVQALSELIDLWKNADDKFDAYYYNEQYYKLVGCPLDSLNILYYNIANASK